MPTPRLPAAAAVLLIAGAAPASAPAEPAGSGYQVAQLIVQQQIVVRVQRPASRAAMPLRPTMWVEKKGPKCIALDTLAGALVVERDAVDLVSEGGERIRARLDDECPALDFYTGFYLKPTKDGQVCAGRDAVRSRSGRKCEIESFRRLVAKP